jgi:formylglycine-generating enzyme required for sulfatase activity
MFFYSSFNASSFNGPNPMPSPKLLNLPLATLPLLFLGIGTAFAAATDAGTTAYIHTVQATESCESCHAKIGLDPFKSGIAGDCKECHSSEDERDVVPVDEKKFIDPYADKLKIAPPPEATAGMSVPWYYHDTRIGKDPSPMAYIPAGKFTRGTNNRLPDEGPQYTAETKAFWIDKYEVTNLQYKQFIDATNRKSPAHFRNRTYPEGKVDHPVVFVSWYDAYDYCKWAGKRLPTDIEWEKAARGSADDRDYPWGDDFDVNKLNSPVRWKALNMEGDTTPVGSFEGGKSPYGVYDMAGNVWEWTDSWYTQYPGNKWPSENYGQLYKVLKGGSWWDCSYYQCGVSAPVFNRSYFKQNVKNSSFGFRCAKDAE